jgi:hypothetical protein
VSGGSRVGESLWEPDSEDLESHIALVIILMHCISCSGTFNTTLLTFVMQRKHQKQTFKVVSGLCPVSISILSIPQF